MSCLVIPLLLCVFMIFTLLATANNISTITTTAVNSLPVNNYTSKNEINNSFVNVTVSTSKKPRLLNVTKLTTKHISTHTTNTASSTKLQKPGSVKLNGPKNVTVMSSDTRAIIRWLPPDFSHSVAHIFKEDRNVVPYINEHISDIPFTYGALQDVINHYDRLKNMAKNVIDDVFKFQDFPLTNATIYHTAKDDTYVSFYTVKITQASDFSNIETHPVDGFLTEFGINDLKPSTRYHVTVTAVYNNGARRSSDTTTFSTWQSGDVNIHHEKCICDFYGHDSSKGGCDPKEDPPCVCREGYMGPFCEFCTSSFYRLSPSEECHRCPCNTEHSTGECVANDNDYQCLKCKPGYVGKYCHTCSPKHYPHNGYCLPCGCNNHDRVGSPSCNDTGHCLYCQHGTAGRKCEKCLEGYVGDALNGVCEPQAVKMSKGAIAAICITLIIFIIIFAGYVVYRFHRPSERIKFWTVEVRGTSDTVTFNDLIEDSEGNLVKPLDDLSFKSMTRSGKKEQPYMVLQEEY